jgi:hypothetical protein
MTDAPKDPWKPETLKAVLCRQLAELEKIRARLQREGKTADDDPELMEVVLELRKFRQSVAEWERELEDESTDESEE